MSSHLDQSAVNPLSTLPYVISPPFHRPRVSLSRPAALGEYIHSHTGGNVALRVPKYLHEESRGAMRLLSLASSFGQTRLPLRAAGRRQGRAFLHLARFLLFSLFSLSHRDLPSIIPSSPSPCDSSQGARCPLSTNLYLFLSLYLQFSHLFSCPVCLRFSAGSCNQYLEEEWNSAKSSQILYACSIRL